MEYRSIAELNDRVVDWSATLPADIDLVVGIPRSGMLVANLLALHRHLPFTDLEGLCEGRILASGQRGVPTPEPGRALHVLVVDDSVCSGISMRRARARIAAADLPHRLLFGAVFATPEAVREGEVDTFAEAVPMPRAFEWNVLYTPRLGYYCVDLEGVLCPAWPPVEAPCGGGEAEPGANAGAPRFCPLHPIGWVVSALPGADREAVAAWLEREGIAAGRLVVSPATPSPRAAIAFKARAYRASGAELFVAGEPGEAAAIAERAGKPVFCFATRSMIYPGQFPRQRHLPVQAPDRLERAALWLRRLPGRCARRLLRIARDAAAAVGLAAPREPSS